MATLDLDLDLEFAGNITYDGFTYNTKLFVEYRHTGVYYFIKTSKGKHILSGIDSAKEKMAKGKKVYVSSGHYFIKRLAIPSIRSDGKRDRWYINNSGDSYSVNKTSKYWKKRHVELSQENITVFN